MPTVPPMTEVKALRQQAADANRRVEELNARLQEIESEALHRVASARDAAAFHLQQTRALRAAIMSNLNPGMETANLWYEQQEELREAVRTSLRNDVPGVQELRHNLAEARERAAIPPHPTAQVAGNVREEVQQRRC